MKRTRHTAVPSITKLRQAEADTADIHKKLAVCKATGGLRLPRVAHPHYDPCPSDIAH